MFYLTINFARSHNILCISEEFSLWYGSSVHACSFTWVLLSCVSSPRADIDECVLGIGICGTNGVCMDTFGSYTCVCDPGYTGNGTECVSKCQHMNSYKGCW